MLDFGSRHLRHSRGDSDGALALDVSLREDDIELLKRATSGFRVEEVDDRDEDGVHDGEKEVGSPTDGGDHGRRDLYDQEVEDPVGGGGDSIGASTGTEGGELGRVEPREFEPGGTEEDDEDEETDGSANTSARGVGDEAAEDDDHGDTLADGSPQEHLTATSTLDEDEREKGRDSINGGVDTAENEGHGTSETDGGFKEDGAVVDNRITSTELLEHLGRGTDEHTTKMLALSARKNVLETRAGLQAGELLDGVENVTLFGQGSRIANIDTVEGSEDLASLIFMAVVEEPSRGFGQGQNTADQGEGKNDLEGDRETPLRRVVDV